MLYKIVPEEHPDFKKLRFVKAVDYVPDWRKRECERQNVISKEDTDKKENTFQIRIKEADIEVQSMSRTKRNWNCIRLLIYLRGLTVRL